MTSIHTSTTQHNGSFKKTSESPQLWLTLMFPKLSKKALGCDISELWFLGLLRTLVMIILRFGNYLKIQDIQISFVLKVWRGDHTHYLASISLHLLTKHFLNMKEQNWPSSITISVKWLELYIQKPYLDTFFRKNKHTSLWQKHV